MWYVLKFRRISPCNWRSHSSSWYSCFVLEMSWVQILCYSYRTSSTFVTSTKSISEYNIFMNYYKKIPTFSSTEVPLSGGGGHSIQRNVNPTHQCSYYVSMHDPYSCKHLQHLERLVFNIVNTTDIKTFQICGC
jgi:hypothetical protein